MPPDLNEHNLLRVLRKPESVTALTLREWDEVIRVARQSRLLAMLRYRLEAAAILQFVPPLPRGHLDAAGRLARHRHQQLRWTLAGIEESLRGLDCPIVLLKGAAYVMADRSFALARMPADIDIMVPRAALDRAEQALLDAGWIAQVTDPYDQRYYREWSHEVPPLRSPDGLFELDLHHTITPPAGSPRLDADSLFAQSIALPGSPWRTLASVDQVLHVAVHLFKGSELSSRLHELVDFECLLDVASRDPDFWPTLRTRAAELGLTRPLWYAVRFTQRILGKRLPRLSGEGSPGWPARVSMHWIVTRALLPDPIDCPVSLDTRIARTLGAVRYHFLRLPTHQLLPHLLRKSLRRTLGLQAR